MRITPDTLKRLHVLLNNTGLIEQKPALVVEYSEGRATSSKDLTEAEATKLCQHLAKLPGADVRKGTAVADADRDPADVMRKKIIRFAHLMAWTKTPGGPADIGGIDRWCRTRGYLHKKGKGLNDYTLKELPKLVSQFQKMYDKFLESPI